jgi:hypothetical protein
MSYKFAVEALLNEAGVESSAMMKTPCLRYHGEFIGMWFDKEDAMIIKIAPNRVQELIGDGEARPFDFTGKRFKEWVLIPMGLENEVGSYLKEALEYAKIKRKWINSDRKSMTHSQV